MDGDTHGTTSTEQALTFEVVPSAGRTIGSLRDIGYELPQAVADLVDNSIEAGSSEVRVEIRFAGTGSWIRVADNGEGMTPEALTESLRIGSVRDYADDDLGKFGLGLKTASISQCRRVSVASRPSDQGQVSVRVFDLDHIQTADRWEILAPDPSEAPEPLVGPLSEHSGTVVLWQDLDRVLVYKDPAGYWAQRKMLEIAETVATHLAMVFHRFIAGEASGREPVRLFVNGSQVEAWDPFCRDQPSTVTVEPTSYPVVSEGNQGIVTLRPYVLPTRTEFTDNAAWNRASGPNKWNNQQGLYVYRADRLIQWGGWNKLRTNDEHNKLARVALDFSPDLDAAFGINISKAIVNLPTKLREDINPAIKSVSQAAQDRYRRGARASRPPATTRPAPSPAPDAPTNERRDQDTPPPSTRPDQEPGVESSRPPTDATDQESVARPTTSSERSHLGEALARAAALAGEAEALRRITESLKSTDPEAANELGW